MYACISYKNLHLHQNFAPNRMNEKVVVKLSIKLSDLRIRFVETLKLSLQYKTQCHPQLLLQPTHYPI